MKSNRWMYVVLSSPLFAWGTASLAHSLGGASPAPALRQDAPAPATPAQEEPPAEAPAAATALSQAELDAGFVAMLSGARLVGYFTDSNLPEGAPLSRDSYTIHKVTKMGGDTWRFDVRIEYGGKDLTVPLALEVKWAGDTPVITLTDFPVFGLGKFTARVLFYRDEYAGTWSGADHGGQMFGRVIRDGERASDSDSDSDSSSDSDGGDQ